MSKSPSLQQLAETMASGLRMLGSTSEARRAEGMRLVRQAQQQSAFAVLEPEVDCAECLRERRAWFATGVADGRLHPLCSRACIESWRRREVGCRVLMRDGRDWQDSWAQGRQGRAA